MLKINRRSLWLLTAGSFYAFFIFGFADNLKGPTLPVLLRDLGFNYSQGGNISLAAYVGFLVATLVTGMLADAAGKKAVIYVAGIALLLGVAGYSTFSSFWLLAASIATLGLGLGAIELGGNSIIVDLHSQEKGRFLNLLATFHGLGSMIAPLYAAQLLLRGFSWRQVYQFSLALVAILPIYFLLNRYPRQEAPRNKGGSLKGLWRSAFGGPMVWFYLLIAAYVAAEIGIGTWIVEFLQKSKGQSVGASSLCLSLFFGAITVGRLAGSLIVERIGYLRIMLLAAAASLACIATGILGPAYLAFLLPFSGFFFSIMFPTATAAVTEVQQENMGTVLGLLFTFAGVGGMLGPWLIGQVSYVAGIRLGFGTLLVFCTLMIVSLLALLQARARHSPAGAGVDLPR